MARGSGTGCTVGPAELTATGGEGGMRGGLEVGGWRGGLRVRGLLVPCVLGGYAGSVACGGSGLVGGGWLERGGKTG